MSLFLIFVICQLFKRKYQSANSEYQMAMLSVKGELASVDMGDSTNPTSYSCQDA